MVISIPSSLTALRIYIPTYPHQRGAGEARGRMAHLLIRRTRNRQLPISILDVGLGSAFQKGDGSIPMSFRDGMMQRGTPIHIRRINRTLMIQQQRHKWAAPHCSRTVNRQLPPPVLHPGAGLMRRSQEESAQREILLRYSEVQGGLPRVRLGVYVGPAREEEGDKGFAGFDGAGDLEGCPAAAVDRVYVEGGLGAEEGYDGEVVVAYCPVKRKAVVAVTAGGEFRAREEELFYFGIWDGVGLVGWL